MWIDLGLKGFQFIFFQRDLIDIYFVDQAVNLIHHITETVNKNSYFISRITVDCNFTASMIYPVHIFRQFFNFSCKNS
jgi:hypothetical protein